ncbi:unnamed protein product [Brassica rapa]|uniref:Uncharacterized protein n=2 Tax=Brassica TaxID=3705 RepID=A0A8D9GIK7_BRACM|nr:unnamed protein product [Brassica napus]CAG7881312.1 unnamed protein product [Brassica rapa]
MGNMCGKLEDGNNTSKHSARDGNMFRYDPSSYSLNFDDGRRENNVKVNMPGGFSSKISTPQSKNLLER